MESDMEACANKRLHKLSTSEKIRLSEQERHWLYGTRAAAAPTKIFLLHHHQHSSSNNSKNMKKCFMRLPFWKIKFSKFFVILVYKTKSYILPFWLLLSRMQPTTVCLCLCIRCLCIYVYVIYVCHAIQRANMLYWAIYKMKIPKIPMGICDRIRSFRIRVFTFCYIFHQAYIHISIFYQCHSHSPHIYIHPNELAQKFY